MALVAIPLHPIPGAKQRDHVDAWSRVPNVLDRRPARRSASRHGRVVARAGAQPVIHPTPAVYRRRRLVVGSLAMAVCTAVAAAVWVVAGALGGGALPAPEAPSTPAPQPAAISSSAVIVQSGDTLWAIARRLQPDGDIRALVDQLAEANGGVDLVAGQALTVDCCQ